ncbi:hypothetical protein BBJ28_00020076, partial [Nothophytophthora sp. Chile5]
LEDAGLPALRRLVRAEFARQPLLVSGAVEQLPEEVEEGNVEYKQQLLEPAPERLRQLTTQLHWRLNEGGGTAFYELGVRDDGTPLGLNEDAVLRSLATLARYEENVGNADRLCVFWLLVSVIGDFESGKSTLVGVLTRGCLDDGCGLARMQVCRHRHELENGRTSSVSEHTIAVAADGRFRCTDELGACDFGDSEDEDEADERRAGDVDKKEKKPESFITFSDLAGHKKYLKSTASGLAGQFPDYAMLVVDAAMGVQAMTREHIKIAAALEVAIFVVLTKTDRTTAERIQQSLVEVAELLQVFCPTQKLVLAGQSADPQQLSTLVTASAAPVFQVSSVDGTGLDVLQGYLTALEPKRVWAARAKTPAEFQISQAYDIEDTGTVVTGLVQSGTLSVGEQMLLGPDALGQFCDVAVDSIEVQRKAAQSLSAGETGAVLVRFLSAATPENAAQRIRKGTMLIHPSVRPLATRQFDAELHFLPDARAFRENFQAVIHAGQVRQMAKLVRIEDSADAIVGQKTSTLLPATTLCRFEFMYWPEYMRPDLPLVLREGSAQAVGRVVRAVEPRVTHVPSC